MAKFAAALVAGLAFSTLAASAATPPPGTVSLDELLSEPHFSNASLSPNGQFLALARNGTVNGVSVTDLQQNKTQMVLGFGSDGAPLKGLHVDWIIWKSDNRLVVGLTLLDINWVGGRVGGSIASLRYGRFVEAFDRDGRNPVRLMEGGFWDGDRSFKLELLDQLPLDPGHILVIAPHNSYFAVWKVDIQTGKGVLVEDGSATTYAWKTDRNGEVVARYREIGSSIQIEGRNPGETNWNVVTTLRPGDLKESREFEFLGPTDKPAELYVAIKPKSAADGEYRSLHKYDFKTKTLGPPLWPDLKHDVEGIAYDGNGFDLAGACYYDATYKCEYKNREISVNIDAISKFFEGKRNVYPISISSDQNLWLFEISGPDEKSSYYLFNWKTKHLDLIEKRFTDLDDDHLAISELYSYKARDGQVITGYLTYLRDSPKAGAPLVVMPHGGPESQDTYGFDLPAQYLATRGYTVFQPNFRGSGGFGRTWAEAGYRQWGGRMADDVTDGVLALTKEGRVDPNRICIFGASYGGYAALYAGATHPELYKCVVSWAGVSDLEASLRSDRDSYGRDSVTYRYWIKSIGDPDAEKPALAKASPVTYAATYQPPVLLIHGDSDTNVKLDQSRRMERALKAAGKAVRLMVYEGEDHRDWSTEHEKAALGEVAAFIRNYIAPFKDFSPPSSPKTDSSKGAQPAAPH